MFSLISRTRRKTPAFRRPFARLMVERLEGRETPSSIDVTSLTAPLTDATTTTGTTVFSPAPAPPTSTGTTATPAPVTPAPVTPAPQAQETETTTEDDIAPDALVFQGYTEDSGWNYSVNGTLTDPNAASFTVTLNVDGNNVGTSSVTPILNPDGSASNTGTWVVTFGLPACTSATNSTRNCVATATNGTQTYTAIFQINQTPRVASTISTSTPS